jgi:hypothetical protein
MASGFYRIENNRLFYTPNDLHGPGYSLFAAEHENYTYPVEGWVWAENREEAKALLGLSAIDTAAKQLEAQLNVAVKAHLDSLAKDRGFDSMDAAASYAMSEIEIFKEDGEAARDYRDAVWVAVYQMLDKVKRTVIPAPTVAQFIAELPTLEWKDNDEESMVAKLHRGGARRPG